MGPDMGPAWGSIWTLNLGLGPKGPGPPCGRAPLRHQVAGSRRIRLLRYFIYLYTRKKHADANVRQSSSWPGLDRQQKIIWIGQVLGCLSRGWAPGACWALFIWGPFYLGPIGPVWGPFYLGPLGPMGPIGHMGPGWDLTHILCCSCITLTFKRLDGPTLLQGPPFLNSC